MRINGRVKSFSNLGFANLVKCLPPPTGTQYSIAIISDKNSWINEFIVSLKYHWLLQGNEIFHTHYEKDLLNADFCFYLGFSKIVTKQTLAKFKHNLVVHESDLPLGRGWSPLTWQILEGLKLVPIVLFEAEAGVDSGAVYIKSLMQFSGYELIEEIRRIQGSETILLCQKFIQDYPEILVSKVIQNGESTFFRKRTRFDSHVDIETSIAENFNLLRVADQKNYPAFFEVDGNYYELQIRGALKPDSV